MENPTGNKTIGILGGMGAAASADFYQRLVGVAQREYHAEDDHDFPPMFIYNLPWAGLDETGFVDETETKECLIESVKKLSDIGSNFIVIPCNTVHYFYDEMQAAIDIPILSILDVTVEAVGASNHTKIGLLNSQSTRNHHLYEDAFAAHGIETISATTAEQETVNAVIGHVIAGTQGGGDIDALNAIISRFIEEGAQAVVLGCTELPLAITQENLSVPLFSSTNILARAALGYAYNTEK